MKKLAVALIACLAIFGASPGLALHPVSLNATIDNGLPDLLNPLAVSSIVSTAEVVPLNYWTLCSERTTTPDINLLNRGNLKLVNGHETVIGSPLLC